MAVLLIRRRDVQGEQLTQGVYCHRNFTPLLALASVVARSTAAHERSIAWCDCPKSLHLVAPSVPIILAATLASLALLLQILPLLSSLASVDMLPTAASHGAAYQQPLPGRAIHRSPLNTSRRLCSRCGASSLIRVKYGATNAPSSSLTSVEYGFLLLLSL